MASRGTAPRRGPLGATALLCAALVTVAAGCAAPVSPDDERSARQASVRVRLPEPGVDFDYQLGGAHPPPEGVRAVVRDRTAEPARGLYNVCYVNAFQAQPDASAWWHEHHPDLLLRDGDGDSDGGSEGDAEGWVVDPDWDEVLLDTSSPDKRRRLAEVVGGWIDDCAAAGYQAVEPDNLDSFGRSEGLLTAEDNLAFGALLVARAHAAGLAVGQKNTAELAARGRAAGFDFAVAEECGQYDECGAYAEAYEDRVFVVEYRPDGFAAACEEWGGRLSVVSRDLDLVAAGEDGYRRRTC
jgi:hypothetical protein